MTRILNHWRGLTEPFHLFAGIYPVLYLYSTSIGLLHPSEVGIPALIALVGTWSVGAIASLIIRERDWARTVACVFVVLVCSYSSIYMLCYRLGALRDAETRDLHFLLGWLGAFTAISAFLIWAKRDLAFLPRFLRTFATFAVAVVMVDIGWKHVNQARLTVPGWERIDPGSLDSRDGEKPNIYYVILDAFGREDVLREIYGMEIPEMIAPLKERGARVLPLSVANYSQTMLSLASSLNMQHLTTLAASMDPDSGDKRRVHAMLRDNEITKILRSTGYATVSFRSGYSATDQAAADLVLSARRSLSEFQQMVLRVSPLPSWLRALPFESVKHWQYDRHRERINFILDSLPKIPDMGRPSFVFAHIVAPHPPFVFDRDGRAVDPTSNFSFDDGLRAGASDEERRGYVDAYVAQATYILRRAVRAIEEIVARDPGAVVIVQGDHGPASRVDLDRTEGNDFRERMSILNMVIGPDHFTRALPPTLTPVNTFRILLREIFGAALEPVPDCVYYSPVERPYALRDVTEELFSGRMNGSEIIPHTTSCTPNIAKSGA